MNKVFYHNHDSQYYSLIRLYENKTVIVNSVFNFEFKELIKNNFERFHYNLEKSYSYKVTKYYIYQNTIFFEFKTFQGYIRYEGKIISEDKISFNIHDSKLEKVSLNQEYITTEYIENKNFISEYIPSFAITNKNNITYPIIIFPEKIIKSQKKPHFPIFTALDFLDIKLPYWKIERKPSFPSKTKLINQEKLVYKGGCVFILLLPMIFFFLIMGGNLFINEQPKMGIFFICVFIFLLYSFNPFKQETELVDIPISDVEYNLMLTKYEEELKLSQEKIINTEKNITIEHNEFEKLLPQRYYKYKYKFILSLVMPYQQPTRSLDKIKRGKSEIYFLEQLLIQYGDQIKVDYKLSLNSFSYYPDFIFICERTNLHIDIEIDEPYTLNEKEPIHFIDSKDEDRDNFFLENNWIVIRFSEEQILKEVDNCIKTIESVRNSIKSSTLHSPLKYNVFVTKHKRWTYEEAIVFAKNRYRENLLNKYNT